MLRDITERKRLEHEIVRSRDLYLTLLEDFPALVWRAGVDGLCDHFNRTWLHFTGRPLEQELGDGWTEGNRIPTTLIAIWKPTVPRSRRDRLSRLITGCGGTTGYTGGCTTTAPHSMM